MTQKQVNVFTKLPVGSTQIQAPPAQPQQDFSKDPPKLNCAQCNSSITCKPELIQVKVCGGMCFKKAHSTFSVSSYCASQHWHFWCWLNSVHRTRWFLCAASNVLMSLRKSTTWRVCANTVRSKRSPGMQRESTTKTATSAATVRSYVKMCLHPGSDQLWPGVSSLTLPGCKLLFRHDLTKNWGKHCHSCLYCHSVSKKLVTAQYGGSTEDFCSEECRSKYTMLFCHVRNKIVNSRLKFFVGLSQINFYWLLSLRLPSVTPVEAKGSWNSVFPC